MSTELKEVCLLPRLKGLGGPASFSRWLSMGLDARGIKITHDPLSPNCQAVLMNGGTSRLDLLWRAKAKGVRIVQRLNGMNWLHRRNKKDYLCYYLKGEYNNHILAHIRRRITHQIVYQSEFSRDWWKTVYKPVRADGPVIYNGTDLSFFTPAGSEKPPEDHIRVLLVEAQIAGGYEHGLTTAIKLVEQLDQEYEQKVELMVVGNVPSEIRQHWDTNTDIWLTWVGVVPRERIPGIERSAHFLFSADLNAACPNSVIEALACGLPVAAYATGSLPELVKGDAGRVVPYGSNYWNLEYPDIPVLVKAAKEILADQPRFRAEARKRAEEKFNVNTMVDLYLEQLLQ